MITKQQRKIKNNRGSKRHFYCTVATIAILSIVQLRNAFNLQFQFRLSKAPSREDSTIHYGEVMGNGVEDTKDIGITNNNVKGHVKVGANQVDGSNSLRGSKITKELHAGISTTQGDEQNLEGEDGKKDDEHDNDIEDNEENWDDDSKDIHGCKYYAHGSIENLPIYNQTTYNFLRQTYLEVVGEEKYKQNIPIGMSEESGIKVPFHIGYSEGKGRGIFLDEPVKKGELVWRATQTADFDNYQSYQAFLGLLPHPLVCDVREWTYMVEVATANDETKSSVYKLRVDLEEAAQMNDGTEEETTNIGCDKESGCDSFVFYALRDLEAGEEVMCDYNDFVIEGGDISKVPQH